MKKAKTSNMDCPFCPFRKGKQGTARADKRQRVHPYYTRRAFNVAVSKACKKAGVHITPNGGRHAAKRRIAGTMGAEAARNVLGHTTTQMIDKYGGFDLALAAEAARNYG